MKQWNKIFKRYGKVFLKPQEDMPRVAKEFKKNKVKKILDLGCGTGRHVVYLAKQGFKVQGLDISEEGLKQTKKWLKIDKLQANLKIGSIYSKLPYNNGTFDAIISTSVIHHAKIKKIRKLIKEMERILKPGGQIFIITHKRKFRNFWPLGAIIKKYGRQKSHYKIIAPHTYTPMSGGEKGLIHYLFNKETIKKEFKNFKLKIWVDKNRRHYCFLGKMKMIRK